MDSYWLEALVKKFENENKISKVISIETENAVPKGDNYLSIVTRGSMSVVLNSGRKTVRRLIIKEQPVLSEEISKVYSVFKTETKVYTQILSEMEKVMNEYGDTGDILWPHLLGYKRYNCIVLEDLTGFKVAERRNFLNLDHSILVVRSLAKFHAMSKILLENGIVTKDDVGMCWASQDHDTVRNALKGVLRQLSNVMKSSWPSKWKPIASNIEAQIESVTKKAKSVFELEDDGFHVINHGDPWTCNMMFRYSPFENAPTSLKFIDFQVCHYNSYIFDLIYFGCSSIIPEIRRKHLDKVLEAYQEALEYYLKLYCYKGKIPDLNHVKAEYQRAQYWTFICFTYIHPITSADSSEAFDVTKLSTKADDVKDDLFKPEVLKSDKLINGIGPDLEILVQNGVI